METIKDQLLRICHGLYSKEHDIELEDFISKVAYDDNFHDEFTTLWEKAIEIYQQK